MGKAHQLITLGLRRQFLVPLFGTFFAVVGTISAALGIVDVHFGMVGALSLSLGALLFSLSIHYRLLNSPQVAVDDVLSSDVDNQSALALHCPCDIKLASEAKKLAEECYSGSVTIEADIFEQLRVKNSYILACLTNTLGEFVGYFDVIPLKDMFAHSLIEGRLTESQISHEDVLGPKEMKTCRYLFISGLAVRQPNTHTGRRNASILVWALLKYLEHYYGASNPLIFALAATREGDELLRRFKLQIRPGSVSRVDGYKLYTTSNWYSCCPQRNLQLNQVTSRT